MMDPEDVTDDGFRLDPPDLPEPPDVRRRLLPRWQTAVGLTLIVVSLATLASLGYLALVRSNSRDAPAQQTAPPTPTVKCSGWQLTERLPDGCDTGPALSPQEADQIWLVVDLQIPFHLVGTTSPGAWEATCSGKAVRLLLPDGSEFAPRLQATLFHDMFPKELPCVRDRWVSPGEFESFGGGIAPPEHIVLRVAFLLRKREAAAGGFSVRYQQGAPSRLDPGSAREWK